MMESAAKKFLLWLAVLALKQTCVTVNAEYATSNLPEFVEFTHVLRGVRDKSLVYIDVRNRTEIETDGRIPGSVVIPLPELEQAFQLESKAFEEKYCTKKPSKSATNLVVACRSGVRAAAAARILQKLGYEHIRIYPGFLDWEEKGGPLVKGPFNKC